MLFVPLDRATQSFLKRGARTETKFLLCFLSGEAATGLAARFGRIPTDVAREIRQPGDDGNEIANRNLLAGTDVNGIGLVVQLGGADDAFGGILDVDELARGRAAAPTFDELVPALPGVDTFFDECRDDMRGRWIKIVARAVEVDR